MKDRLIFKKIKLKNGMHIYARHMNVPFVMISIYIPLGHIHNTDNVLPGTAHFLEHIISNRSHLYPKSKQFEKLIELKGGYINAPTNSILIEYYMGAPAHMFKDAFMGLKSLVFEPIITTKDIKHEAGIILNESRMSNEWYPGGDELDHHIRAKWRNETMMSHRQRIGNASDLRKMTVTRLSNFHKLYFDPQVYVVVGGKFDEKIIVQELSKIKTKRHTVPVKFEQVRWARREYHEKKFDGINRFLYRFGGIFTERDLITRMAINFIGQLLTNSTHGVFVEWLRNDLNWSYNIDFTLDYLENPYFHNNWEICIPLNNRTQVRHVRNEIHKRILKAISNKKLVATEVKRLKAAHTFSYQTLTSIISEADSMLGIGGKLSTEKEIVRAIEHCSDISFLKEIYDKHFSPDVIGEFLAVPQKARR